MPIEKTLIAPKTWELKNIEPEPYLGPTPAEAAAQQAQAEMQARMFEENQRQVDIEQADIPFDQGPQTAQDYMRMAKEASGKQKKEWRNQLRDFFSEMDDPRANPVQGIQSLLDSGAIWMSDEEGVWSGVAGKQGRKGKEQNQRLLDAAREWGDWYRDQMEAGQPLADDEMRSHMERETPPAMSDEPTIGTEELTGSIRDQISAAKRLGMRG